MTKKKKYLLSFAIIILLIMPTAIFFGGRYFLNQGKEIMEEDPEGARRYFKTATRLNPFSGKAYAMKAVTFYNHDELDFSADTGKVSVPEEVIQNYEKAITGFNTPTRAYLNLGEIYYNYSAYYGYIRKQEEEGVGYAQKAIPILRKAADEYSDSWIYYMIGYLKVFVLEEPEEAISYFEKGKGVDSDHPRSYYGLAYAHTALENWEEALHYYDESIQREPTSRAYVGRGFVIWTLSGKEAPAGLADYEKALELNPNNITALHNVMLSYYDLGVEANAKHYLERLKRVDEIGVYEEKIKEYEKLLN